MNFAMAQRLLLVASDELLRCIQSGLPWSSNDGPAERSVYFTARNRSGSVEHYYHFLLGLFLPLMLTVARNTGGPAQPIYIVRSCGPFDKMLCRALGDRIQIMERIEHRCRAFVASRVMRRSSVMAEGFDDPSAYDAGALREGTLLIRSLLAEETEREARLAQARFTPEGPNILIVDRGRSPAFYQSVSAEIKGSGAERRSIANMDALASAIQKVQPDALLTTLEGMSLAAQIALFDTADVIIAQHGAALANLVWARPATQVIEIIPPTMRPEVLGRDFFGDLARCLDQSYFAVSQDGDHEDAPIADILAALGKTHPQFA